MKKKEAVIQFIINLSLLFITWGGLFRKSFNCDTLTYIADPVGGGIIPRFECGRYLSGLLEYLLSLTGITTGTHTGLSVMAEILMLAAALCIIQNVFTVYVERKTSVEKIGFYIITGLLFINVLFGENLMFGECALSFGPAYLLASVGVWYFTKHKYLTAFLVFILSTAAYQIGVIYAAIIISVWIFIKNQYKISVKAVKEEFICGIITFGAGLINMLSSELLMKIGVLKHIYKDAGVGDISYKLVECVRNFVSLLYNSKGLLPGVWLPLLILLILTVIIIYRFIKDKNWMAVGYFVLLAAACFIMIYIIPFAQNNIYLPPRIIYPFYVVQSMLMLIAFIISSGRVRQIFSYICCGYLLIQIVFCHMILANREASNTLDEVYANMVYEKILDYEEITGETVTKLAVVNDLDCPPSYNEVHYKTDQINERALGTVTNTLVNVMSGRYFEKIEMNEDIYNEYFEGKNWDYFDESEQLVIKGDTAYWAVF